MSPCIEAKRGAYSDRGYWQVTINGRKFYQHRLVAMLFLGLEIQDTTTVVCHKCDNPACINPEHLFLGTQRDNMQDMVRKNRQGIKNRVGVRNGRATLTEQQVLEIFKRGKTQKYTRTAQEFGTTAPIVANIVRRKTWAHLTEGLS